MYLNTKQTNVHGKVFNWPMRSRELLTELGLKPTSPIPPDFECIRIIDDGNGDAHTIRVVPARNGKHRVFVDCTRCEKIIPAGRIRQHAKVHS